MRSKAASQQAAGRFPPKTDLRALAELALNVMEGGVMQARTFRDMAHSTARSRSSATFRGAQCRSAPPSIQQQGEINAKRQSHRGAACAPSLTRARWNLVFADRCSESHGSGSRSSDEQAKSGNMALIFGLTLRPQPDRGLRLRHVPRSERCRSPARSAPASLQGCAGSGRLGINYLFDGARSGCGRSTRATTRFSSPCSA